MIEKLSYYYNKVPQNAYSFYVHPLGNFGIGQGADGFAINTNYLGGIVDFYNDVVKDYHELFLYDDLWISYFLYYFKKNKILSLQELLEIDASGKRKTIYKFENPLEEQPNFGIFNDDQTKFIVTSALDILFVDMNTELEIDIDE